MVWMQQDRELTNVAAQTIQSAKLKKKSILLEVTISNNKK
jgi:hypothetical protein